MGFWAGFAKKQPVTGRFAPLSFLRICIVIGVMVMKPLKNFISKLRGLYKAIAAVAEGKWDFCSIAADYVYGGVNHSLRSRDARARCQSEPSWRGISLIFAPGKAALRGSR